jgi:hypothetical protein
MMTACVVQSKYQSEVQWGKNGTLPTVWFVLCPQS